MLDAARDRGDLIVHVRHEFPDASAPFFHPGSEGANINPAAAPQGNEIIVTKNQVNAFKDTDLKRILDEGTTVPAAQVHAAMMSGLAFGYATVTDAKDWIAGQSAG